MSLLVDDIGAKIWLEQLSSVLILLRPWERVISCFSLLLALGNDLLRLLGEISQALLVSRTLSSSYVIICSSFKHLLLCLGLCFGWPIATSTAWTSTG